jgi:AcrR family transcriptional regulator
MTISSPTPALRGRPRSLRAKHAVLDAVRDLMGNGGYPAATIEAIAARSGVAKTTIYRWWPNRPSLVVDLLVQIANQVAPPPAGGDPVRAVCREMRAVAEAVDGFAGHLLISLLGEAQSDPDIHNALMRGVFHPRRHATAKVVRRGQASGVFRRDIPPLLAVDLLFGPLFYRRIVLHQPVSGAFAKHVVRHVLDELLVSPARRK